MPSILSTVRIESTLLGIVALRDDRKQLELERYLRELGLQVRAARTGADVLVELADAILEDGLVAERPRVLVLDDRLHGVLGSCIADGIRALGWDTLVVLLGADSSHSCDTSIAMRQDADIGEISAAIGHSLGSLDRRTPAVASSKAAVENLGIVGWSLDRGSDLVTIGLPALTQPPMWEGTLSAWLTTIHPDDRLKVARDIAGQVLGGLNAVAMRIRLQRPEGDYRNVEFQCAPGPGHRLMGAIVDVKSLENRASRHEIEERRSLGTDEARNPDMHFDIVLRDIDTLIDELGFELVEEITERAAARARAFLRNGDQVLIEGLGVLGVHVEASVMGPDGLTLKRRLSQALKAPMRVQNITIALNLYTVPKDASWQLANAQRGRGARAP